LIDSINTSKWMTHTEAVSALVVKSQTVYTNVSRKRIRTKPDQPTRARASTTPTTSRGWRPVLLGGVTFPRKTRSG
jgi:hypothetical protein